VRANVERSSEGPATRRPAPDDLSLSQAGLSPSPAALSSSSDNTSSPVNVPAGAQPAPTLGDLPLGARLVLRCRKDWRAAAVAARQPDGVTLTVCSPNGHTYRVRRPADAALAFHGHIPVLGDREHASWLSALARYDARW
jgi:hypothetical protein